MPLAQLDVVHADEETRQAVEDWHYWVDDGVRVLIGDPVGPRRVNHS